VLIRASRWLIEQYVCRSPCPPAIREVRELLISPSPDRLDNLLEVVAIEVLGS